MLPVWLAWRVFGFGNTPSQPQAQASPRPSRRLHAAPRAKHNQSCRHRRMRQSRLGVNKERSLTRPSFGAIRDGLEHAMRCNYGPLTRAAVAQVLVALARLCRAGDAVDRRQAITSSTSTLGSASSASRRHLTITHVTEPLCFIAATSAATSMSSLGFCDPDPMTADLEIASTGRKPVVRSPLPAACRLAVCIRFG